MHALQCAALACRDRADDEVIVAALLHDIGKRYLCTVDARYVERLSPVSRRSYAAQGARLTLEERLGLETQPWFADAVRLRRWDDAAKVPGAPCAPLVEYAPLLERRFGPQAWVAEAGLDGRS